MRTLLAISPHLDDAIFSAGGTLAQRARDGWRVIIATCFTATVANPTGFALACQTDKGLDPAVDYMALRRLEDDHACAAIGATPLHMPFAEAPHRGYDSAAALFAGYRPDDAVQSALQPALVTLIETIRPEIVFGPIGLGGHVDHLVVTASLAAIGVGSRLMAWEDWPYVDREAGDALADRPHAVVDLTPSDLEAKIKACGAYRSQLAFQFQSEAAMVARLRARPRERFKLCAPA